MSSRVKTQTGNKTGVSAQKSADYHDFLTLRDRKNYKSYGFDTTHAAGRRRELWPFVAVYVTIFRNAKNIQRTNAIQQTNNEHCVPSVHVTLAAARP
jgi:hypothetical protein